MTPVLSAEGLQKRFGAVVAADAVTIAVPPGQKVSLIGSNGAGKTTFVNMVTGYLKPDAGRILLEGREVTRLGPRELSGLGVCRSFQIPQLFVELTVLQNLLVALAIARPQGRFSLRRADDAALAEEARGLLERFGIAVYADYLVSELSGGVRKLLDIAMALARHPKLLLLDEPTSGVSAEEKFPVMDRVMGALLREAVTVLFVEHDMEIVTRYAERVIAFYAGRVLADGPPAEVLDDPEVRRYVTGGQG